MSTTYDTQICVEVGHHSWHGRGLDVVRGRLVSVRRCVWCGKETHSAYKERRR